MKLSNCGSIYAKHYYAKAANAVKNRNLIVNEEAWRKWVEVGAQDEPDSLALHGAEIFWLRFNAAGLPTGYSFILIAESALQAAILYRIGIDAGMKPETLIDDL